MTMHHKLSLAAALFAVTACAQTLPPGVTKGPSLAGITEYHYTNGLKVLLLPDSSSPKLTVNMTYLVGSRHEGYGESGMAHLLEHMNFIMSAHGRDVKKELADHGAEFNGTTSYDRTNYYETVTASDDNLKWALSLEAERMVSMRIEKQLLDTEMTVVRNEFERGENSPQRVLMERVTSTAYLWHNYGKSTIGSLADIERVPVNRLADFYRKYYQPDNAVLMVAGKFDESKALSLIAETSGAIPRPTRVLDQTYTQEPAQDGERTVELRRVGTNPELMIAWHAAAFTHPDSAALEVLSGVLATGGRGGGTGRLYKALIESKKALSINMDYAELHDPGWVMAIASLNKEQSIDDVRKTILDTIAGVAAEPPTAEEVERVKSRITQGMEQGMTNSQAIAMELTDSIASGDWRLFFLNYDELKKVTPEDVARVAKLYFKPSNRTVGTFVPEAAPERTVVPDGPPVESQLKDFKTTLATSKGEDFDPSPANVEKLITRATLPGGLKLAMLHKSTRGDRVTVSLNLHFGDEASLNGRRGAASMAGAMLMRGTKQKTREQLQNEMVKLDAQINVAGSLTGASASVSTTAPNLPEAMKLAAEMLRESSFPESEFEQVKKQRLAGLENGKTEPETLARLNFQRTINPYPRGNIRYVPTIEEELEEASKVTLDDVRKFYADFYGASNGELVIVGQFDPAAMRKTSEELFGTWKSPKPYKRIVNTYAKIEPKNLKVETPDKQNALFEAGQRLQLKDTDPDFPALVLADFMFGGSANSRAFDRIRNREGLSYGVNSVFQAPSEGDLATFIIAAIANPKNTPKVEASFLDEFKKTVNDGYTDKEISDFRKALLEERMVGRSQDGQLVRIIAIREENNRTLQWDVDMDAKFAALTTAQVNAAMKRHFDPAAISIVKAGDFKAAGAY